MSTDAQRTAGEPGRDVPKVTIPARLDGDMLACIIRTFPECELEIKGVMFTINGTEFRTETMEGAVALLRAIATRGAT